MRIPPEYNYELLTFGNNFTKMKNCFENVRCGLHPDEEALPKYIQTEKPGAMCKSYRDGECKLIGWMKFLMKNQVQFKE